MDPALRERLHDTLAGIPGLDLALLFGSRARGDARPESDVDLAVLGPGLDRFALLQRLLDVLQRDVDLVDLSTAGVPILEEILRDGIVVYEGHPGAAAQWRSGCLLALEVDRPWFHRMRDAWLARVAAGGSAW